MKTRKIIIETAVKIPDTDIILEAGDELIVYEESVLKEGFVGSALYQGKIWNIYDNNGSVTLRGEEGRSAETFTRKEFDHLVRNKMITSINYIESRLKEGFYKFHTPDSAVSFIMRQNYSDKDKQKAQQSIDKAGLAKIGDNIFIVDKYDIIDGRYTEAIVKKEGEKIYYRMDNIGKAKYTVNYHDSMRESEVKEAVDSDYKIVISIPEWNKDMIRNIESDLGISFKYSKQYDNGFGTTVIEVTNVDYQTVLNLVNRATEILSYSESNLFYEDIGEITIQFFIRNGGRYDTMSLMSLNKYESKLKEAVDIKKIIKDLQGDFGGSNESQMKGVQLLKGLATSEDPLSNKFMKALNTATTKISKEVLGEGKKESIKEAKEGFVYEAEIGVTIHEDSYEQGEGRYIQEYIVDTVESPALKGLVNKISQTIGVDEKGILYGNINEYEWAGELWTDQMQNADGYRPSKDEIEQWKRDELTLYSASYHILVSKVGKAPVSEKEFEEAGISEM